MARNTETCRWCAGVAAVAVLLVGWFGFVRGEARPELLRLRAQEQLNHEFALAGHPWMNVRIEGNTARVQGRAPSDDALHTAQGKLERLLSPYMGIPGVFARLQTQFEVMSAAEQQAARDTRGLQDGMAQAAAQSAPVADAEAVAVAASASPSLTSATAMAISTATTAAPVPLSASTTTVPPSPPPLAVAPAPAPAVIDAAATATIRPDPQCQRELDQLQQTRVLHFRAGSATLDVGQDEALDSLAALFKRCPDGRVLVHGLREPSPGLASVVLPAASAPWQAAQRS